MSLKSPKTIMKSEPCDFMFSITFLKCSMKVAQTLSKLEAGL
jgi:hypothetical protein